MSLMELAIERATSALFLIFTADALSMPVHWYYNPAEIPRSFPSTGGIVQMEAAPSMHPSSIMNLHSTTQGGRHGAIAAGKGKPQEIVGDVILKGKRQFWNGHAVHYHHGMPAGENTLNAHCARLLMRYLSNYEEGTKNGGAGLRKYEPASYLDAYIQFMTTEGSHPDTYAESYHRGFFSNLVNEKMAPEKCAQVTHDTPSVGGLVTVAPLAIAELLKCGAAGKGGAGKDCVQEVQRISREHLALTHPDKTLFRVCDDYVELMARLMFRDEKSDLSAQEIIKAAAHKALKGKCSDLDAVLAKAGSAADHRAPAARGVDSAVVGGAYSTACYITDSWPSLLYLAARYAEYPEQGMLANTNLGGENCHRGSVLGTLLGLAAPTSTRDLPLTKQLKNYDVISTEITDMIAKASSKSE